MRYRLLGRTGLRVSELALGAMTFGSAFGPMGATEDAARRIVERYLAAGGNFIDTANNYQAGEAERAVGAAIADERDRLVVATKYTLSTRRGDPNGWGNHRKNMVQSVEASLGRLGTDRIDLLWVHIWDFTTAIDEVMRGLEDLTRAGKILHCGASDTPAWVVAQANTTAMFRGWNPFSAIQVEYNLLERTVEHELIPMTRAHDLAVLAWSPLAMGILTGKYAGGLPADTGRADWVASRLDDRAHRVVDVVVAIAREAGHTPAQVAINWLRQRPGNVIPILGARTPEQLDDVLGALAFTLDPAQLERLDAVSAIEPTFPASMWSEERLVNDIITGGTSADIDGWTLPR